MPSPAPLRLTTTVRRSSRQAVLDLLRSLPAQLTGKVPDPDQLQKTFLSHFTRSLFQSIHVAFLAKSRGGRDNLGNAWKPLAPSTIKRKQKSRRAKSPHPHDPMSTTQRRTWSTSYNRTLRKLAGTPMSSSEKKLRAREVAWNQLKYGKAGLSRVPVGIDTGRLEASLRPGHVAGQTTYKPANSEQHVELSEGKLTLGTNVPHASYFHRVRRIYPSIRKIRPWTTTAARAGRDAVLRRLQTVVRRRAR